MRPIPLWVMRRAALVFLLAWGVGPVAATACVTDGECVDGDSCSIADTCQAGVCVPGGGGDSDHDGTCDADDDSDRPLTFTKARLRPLLALSISLVKIEGFFPVGVADPFDPLQGFTVQVTDGLSYSTTQVFAPGECKPSSATVQCKTTAPGKVSRATFKGFGPANPVLAFKFKLTQQALGGPFLEPLTARVRQTGTPVDRVGSIVDCKIVTSGIKCRQF